MPGFQFCFRFPELLAGLDHHVEEHVLGNVRRRILLHRASLHEVVALELVVLGNGAVGSALRHFLAGQPLRVAALVVNGLIISS